MLFSVPLLWTCVFPFIIILLAFTVLFFERKLIGLYQSSLSVSFMGSHGWVHVIADVVNFWFKYTNNQEISWYSFSAGTFSLSVGFMLWNLCGLVFLATEGGFIAFDFWNYQILSYVIFANLTTVYFFSVVVSMRSKYALLAGVSILLISIFLEVYFTLMFYFIVLLSGNFSFNSLFVTYSSNWLSVSIPPLALVFLMFILAESNRAPFDHAEAESELVAGQVIDAGGRTLLLLFISEYIHVLFCFNLILLFLFGGGSSLPGFIPLLFI